MVTPFPVFTECGLLSIYYPRQYSLINYVNRDKDSFMYLVLFITDYWFYYVEIARFCLARILIVPKLIWNDHPIKLVISNTLDIILGILCLITPLYISKLQILSELNFPIKHMVVQAIGICSVGIIRLTRNIVFGTLGLP